MTCHEKLLAALPGGMPALVELQKESGLPAADFWKAVMVWLACYISHSQKDGNDVKGLVQLFCNLEKKVIVFSGGEPLKN